jgi:hypothetical protein
LGRKALVELELIEEGSDCVFLTGDENKLFLTTLLKVAAKKGLLLLHKLVEVELDSVTVEVGLVLGASTVLLLVFELNCPIDVEGKEGFDPVKRVEDELL